MPRSCRVAAMRVGPSRLTSTASSSGESNDTAAAEWITVSHDARTVWSASERPRPSVPTSPVTTVRRRARSSSQRLGPAQLGAQAVERVVADDLALDALGRRRPPAGPHEQDELAVGHGPQQPLDQRGADEAGRPGDGDARAGECLGDHGELLTIW